MVHGIDLLSMSSIPQETAEGEVRAFNLKGSVQAASRFPSALFSLYSWPYIPMPFSSTIPSQSPLLLPPLLSTFFPSFPLFPMKCHGRRLKIKTSCRPAPFDHISPPTSHHPRPTSHPCLPPPLLQPPPHRPFPHTTDHVPRLRLLRTQRQILQGRPRPRRRDPPLVRL